MPRFEVRYADVMRPLEMGYAIWQADPFDEYEKITLGCAGEINKGKLTPRWQMWQDASYLEGQIHRQRIEARKPLHTTNVKEVDVDISLSSDTLPAPASAGFGIGYQCTDSRAGLLSLKDGYAISEDLRKRREKELTKYLISHHEEIMSACEIEDLEELAVVTGTTMTGDWDAVYLESSSREGRVSVEAGLSQVLLQRTDVVVKHSRNQNPFLSSGHHHNPPRDPGLLLLKRPLRKTPKVIKAAAEPKEYDRDSDTGYDTDSILSASTDSIGSSSDEERLLVVKDEDDEVVQAPDLVDQAFDYIFSNCNAELAIVHDRDIEKMRGGLNGNSSSRLKIAINEEFSVASLFHEDNPAVDSEWDIVDSAPPDAYYDEEPEASSYGVRFSAQRYPIPKEPPPSRMIRSKVACRSISDHLSREAAGTSLGRDSAYERIITTCPELSSLMEARPPHLAVERPPPDREVGKSSSTNRFAMPPDLGGLSATCTDRERNKARTAIHKPRRPDDSWHSEPNLTPLLDPDLSNKLSRRHISMITIGGVIGVGLFLGAPTLLSRGGPLGLVAAYMILGTTIFSMMSCIGEMLSSRDAPEHGIPVKPAMVGASVAAFIACDFFYYLWDNSISSHDPLIPRNTVTRLLAIFDPMWIVPLCIVTAFHPVLGAHRIRSSMESYMSLLKILVITCLIVFGIGVERGKWHGPDQVAFRYWEDLVNTFLARDTASLSILKSPFFISLFIESISVGVSVVVLANLIRSWVQSRRKPKWNALDFYLFGLLVSDLFRALSQITSERLICGQQVTKTAFCTAQGVIQSLGETISATMPFVVTAETLLEIAFHYKLRRDLVRKRLVLSLSSLTLPLFHGIGSGLDRLFMDHGPNFVEPIKYWCWISNTFPNLQGEYIWLWIAAASSIILLSFLFTLTRFYFATSRKIIPRTSVVDLTVLYPAVYTMLVLPICLTRWISFTRDSESSIAIGAVVAHTMESPALWVWSVRISPLFRFCGCVALLFYYSSPDGDGMEGAGTGMTSHVHTLHDAVSDSVTTEQEYRRGAAYRYLTQAVLVGC